MLPLYAETQKLLGDTAFKSYSTVSRRSSSISELTQHIHGVKSWIQEQVSTNSDSLLSGTEPLLTAAARCGTQPQLLLLQLASTSNGHSISSAISSSNACRASSSRHACRPFQPHAARRGPRAVPALPMRDSSYRRRETNRIVFTALVVLVGMLTACGTLCMAAHLMDVHAGYMQLSLASLYRVFLLLGLLLLALNLALVRNNSKED